MQPWRVQHPEATNRQHKLPRATSETGERTTIFFQLSVNYSIYYMRLSETVVWVSQQRQEYFVLTGPASKMILTINGHQAISKCFGICLGREGDEEGNWPSHFTMSWPRKCDGQTLHTSGTGHTKSHTSAASLVDCRQINGWRTDWMMWFISVYDLKRLFLKIEWTHQTDHQETFWEVKATY